jgi:hypothetical protein
MDARVSVTATSDAASGGASRGVEAAHNLATQPPSHGATEITCDQAIFTSARTPMGEGYRVIAASKGLHVEEKQAITRCSPSHDALCSRSPDATGMAFYALPTGRLCVAHSCYAGAEHTGRGGHRVYTINVILTEEDFEAAAYNPFEVLRRLRAAGAVKPQLKPPGQLPPIRLDMCNDAEDGVDAAWSAPPASAARKFLISEILGDGKVIACVPADFETTAEALLAAVPGPLRARVPLSAGLRFSVGRGHRLCVLCDDKGATRTRIEGQPITFVDGQGEPPRPAPRSDWLRFVDTHLEDKQIAMLAGRTSHPFTDVSPNGRERIAKLYLSMDEIPSVDASRLLALAGEHLDTRARGFEQTLVAQLLEAVQAALLDALDGADEDQLKRQGGALIESWKRCDVAATVFQPVVDRVLRTLADVSPVAAVELALTASRGVPAAAKELNHDTVLDHVLNRFAAWCETVKEDDQRETIRMLCQRWQSARPQCPIVTRLAESLASQVVTEASTRSTDS